MTVDAPDIMLANDQSYSLREASPIDNAQNELQVLCGRRFLPGDLPGVQLACDHVTTVVTPRFGSLGSPAGR